MMASSGSSMVPMVLLLLPSAQNKSGEEVKCTNMYFHSTLHGIL